MIPGLLLSLALAEVASLSPAQAEARAVQHVRREFERIGRQAPVPDPVLTEAARALAREALNKTADEAADLLVISQVVSDAGGFDPTPRAVVIRAIRGEDAVSSFLRREDCGEEPASHFGVGAVVLEERAVLVALFAQRRARLEPFPRRLRRAGETPRLCGELTDGLGSPELYVTRPSGEVDRLAIHLDGGGRFCARIPFPTAGRHTLEVIGRATRGPEVAALFFADVGVPPQSAARLRIPEPTTLDEARAVLLLRINGLRGAHGTRPLTLDPRLSAIAQAHSERMAQEHFFAHVSPTGDDLRARLTAARYLYSRAGENLGLAAGPVAAHFAIEHSPGHRRNLLDPEFTTLGIGLAFESVGGRRQAILTEVLAKPSNPAPDPVAAAYRTLFARRAQAKLPPLARSQALEAIALEHARRALQLDQPKIDLPGANVHERVFQAMDDARSAAVDLYVSDDPAQLPSSKSLEDGKNDRVGIGAVRGDSPTYGQEKFWVVVVYADSQ